MRAEGRPSASAVARVMASGSSSPLARAAFEPLPEESEWVVHRPIPPARRGRCRPRRGLPRRRGRGRTRRLVGRDERRLHLHRLEEDERLPRLDALALGREHADDDAGHRRLDHGLLARGRRRAGWAVCLDGRAAAASAFRSVARASRPPTARQRGAGARAADSSAGSAVVASPGPDSGVADEPAEEREVRRRRRERRSPRAPAASRSSASSRVSPVRDELRDHGVVGDRHLVARLHARVDADRLGKVAGARCGRPGGGTCAGPRRRGVPRPRGLRARSRSRPSGSPAAIRSCCSTRSSPVTSSVTGCSTWMRAFSSRKQKLSSSARMNSAVPAPYVAERRARARRPRSPIAARAPASSAGEGLSSSTFW